MAEIENNPILKIDATFDTGEAAERFMKELDPSLTFYTSWRLYINIWRKGWRNDD